MSDRKKTRIVSDQYDLVVIGGGTGGYSAAFRASELGLSAAIVERELLGGTCLHRGCVPAKTILQAANLLEAIGRADRLGLRADGGYDWSKIMENKKDVVNRIFTGLRKLAAERNVEIIEGYGRLKEDNSVMVDNDGKSGAIRFKSAVLATGSAPRRIPGIRLGWPVITSDEALRLERAPSSAIIVGGGYIGVEFASMWRSFGAEVTVVEAAPRLMINEDAEISDRLAGALKDRGIKILTGAELKTVDVKKGSGAPKARAIIIDKDGERIEAEAELLLEAVGRVPVTAAFEGAGVTTARGYVVTDDRLQTTRPGVYAVGDLLPTMQLAQAAFAEGFFAAEGIAGLDPEPVNYDAIPRCVYSVPEVAAVGLTEAGARDSGYDIAVVREPFSANAKAKIAGEPEGEVKIVSQSDGSILGVHMIGPGVSELAAEAMLITGWQADPKDLAALMHPHPTLSEAIGEGALKLAGKPLHSP